MLSGASKMSRSVRQPAVAPRPPPVSPFPRGEGDGRGRGENHHAAAPRRTDQPDFLPGSPPQSRMGVKPSKSKPHAGAKRPAVNRPISGRHDRSEAEGVTAAGQRFWHPLWAGLRPGKMGSLRCGNPNACRRVTWIPCFQRLRTVLYSGTASIYAKESPWQPQPGTQGRTK